MRRVRARPRPSSTRRGAPLKHSAQPTTVVGAPKTATADNPVAVASAEIEQCRTTRLPIAEWPSSTQHPEQATFLFEGLDLGDAAEAVVTLSLFLDRLDQLESGKERKTTHKADLAVVATLEARGFTKAERKRLRTLVHFIQTSTAPMLDDAASSGLQDEKLLELEAWLDESTSVAKIVIKPRAQLLELGIGKRRSRKAAPEPTDPTIPVPAPVAPAPVTTTPVVTTPVATTPSNGSGEPPAPNSSGPSAPQRAARAA